MFLDHAEDMARHKFAACGGSLSQNFHISKFFDCSSCGVIGKADSFCSFCYGNTD